MDVGPSMDIAPPSGGETSLEMAIRVANQIVQQKVGLVREVCVCVCLRYKHKSTNIASILHNLLLIMQRSVN